MTRPGRGAEPRAGSGLAAGVPTMRVSAPASIAQANLLWARALVDGLVASGVRHLCLSPGSRSSPLAFAAHAEPRIAISVQIDERSAAFLALGIAKATRAPVAIVCTSGTAAANFLPAVAEAFLAGVPLVVLTADRPPELRGTGAAQTIDQLHLYGSHVRLFRDLPCADDEGAHPAVAAQAARDACLAALAGPVGPVHLNVPFREPLVPAPDEMSACEEAWLALAPQLRAVVSGTVSDTAKSAAGLPALKALAARLGKAQRPLLVAGPGAVTVAEASAVLDLARAARMPILADIASGLRGAVVPEGVTVCSLSDLFLRDEALAALAPDFVLRLGGIPTSKTLATWLALHRPPLVAIQPDQRRRDPDGIVTEVVVGPAAATCAALATHVKRASRDEGEWTTLLETAEAGARALLPGVAARSGRRRGCVLCAANAGRALPVEQHADPLGGDGRADAGEGRGGVRQPRRQRHRRHRVLRHRRREGKRRATGAGDRGPRASCTTRADCARRASWPRRSPSSSSRTTAAASSRTCRWRGTRTSSSRSSARRTAATWRAIRARPESSTGWPAPWTK